MDVFAIDVLVSEVFIMTVVRAISWTLCSWAKNLLNIFSLFTTLEKFYHWRNYLLWYIICWWRNFWYKLPLNKVSQWIFHEWSYYAFPQEKYQVKLHDWHLNIYDYFCGGGCCKYWCFSWQILPSSVPATKHMKVSCHLLL